MNKLLLKCLLLKCLLWLMSIIRAAVISGGIYCLYLIIAVIVFNSNPSSIEDHLLPVIAMAFLFVLLVINDGNWVNKEFNKFKNYKYE